MDHQGGPIVRSNRKAERGRLGLTFPLRRWLLRRPVTAGDCKMGSGPFPVNARNREAHQSASPLSPFDSLDGSCIPESRARWTVLMASHRENRHLPKQPRRFGGPPWTTYVEMTSRIERALGSNRQYLKQVRWKVNCLTKT